MCDSYRTNGATPNMMRQLLIILIKNNTSKAYFC